MGSLINILLFNIQLYSIHIIKWKISRKNLVKEEILILCERFYFN